MPAPAPSPDTADLIQQLVAAAGAAGFQSEQYGATAGWPLLAFTKPGPAHLPKVYLSAGIHGDEPAPPRALLRLLREGVLDDRARWYLCPLLNPAGLLAGHRENAQGLDLNRDYKDLRAPETRAHVAWLERQPRFDLNLCLHEDWESTGYYLYELNPDGRPSLAQAMIAAAAAHCPIESAALIDGRPADERGIIRPVSDPLLRENWPEAIYLRHSHGTLNYTLETPSALPLDQRIATHCAVLRRALADFLGR